MWACAEDGFTSENQGTGSTLGTIFNMTNSALGAGILAFPYAFSKVWSCVVALLRCCVVVLLCCCVVLSVCWVQIYPSLFYPAHVMVSKVLGAVNFSLQIHCCEFFWLYALAKYNFNSFWAKFDLMQAGIIGAILVMTFVFIFAIFTNIALVVFAHNYCSTCKSYQVYHHCTQSIRILTKQLMRHKLFLSLWEEIVPIFRSHILWIL